MVFLKKKAAQWLGGSLYQNQVYLFDFHLGHPNHV
jgi:hypothetical protein